MRIALSASIQKKADKYIEALVQAGTAREEIVSLLADSPEQFPPAVDDLNGLLLSGGADIDPPLFGETRRYDNVKVDRTRDDAELKLLAEFRKRRLPILCICRGIQVLNVAHKGTLYQDLLRDKVTTHQHKQTEIKDVGREKETHAVTIKPDSLLARVMGTTSSQVNSTHHQAVKDVGKGLRVVARSEDNVIEGIELEEDYPFLLAVEWHPEELVHRPPQLRIFERFLAACRTVGA